MRTTEPNMKKMALFIVLLFTGLVFGCVRLDDHVTVETPVPASLPSPTASVTILPIIRSTNTLQPTLTSSPILATETSPAPSATATPTHVPRTPISKENLDRLEIKASLGGFSGFDLLWSQDGNLILVAGESGIRMLDPGTYKLAGEFKTGYPVQGLLLSADDRKIISVDSNDHGELFDRNTGSVIASFEELQEVSGFCPPDKILSIYKWWSIRLYCLSPNANNLLVNSQTKGNITVAFSPDEKLAAFGGQDGMEVIDVSNQNKKIWNTQGIDDRFYFVSAIAFAPDGQSLAAFGLGKLIFWNSRQGSVIQSLVISDEVRKLSYNPDGTKLALLGSNGLRIVDISDNYRIREIGENPGYVFGIAISPDQRLLATGSPDNSVKLWDLNTFRLLEVMDRVNTDGKDVQIRVNGSVAFSPDMKILASGGSDGVYLWDVQSRKFIQKLEAGHVRSIAFSPDSKTLASESCPLFQEGRNRYWIECPSNSITLWDIASGRSIWQNSLGGDQPGRAPFTVGWVVFRPDGKQIASVGPGNEINLLDAATGKLDRVFEHDGHVNTVQNVAFSADGKYLASAGFDGRIKLWEMESGQVIRTFSPNFPVENRNTRLVFNHDSSLLISLRSHRMTLEFWDPSTGERLLSKELSTEPKGGTLLDFKVAVTFTSNGGLLCTGGHSGAVLCFGVH